MKQILKRIFLILTISIVLCLLVSSCSRPAGFPAKVVPFSLKILSKGEPVQNVLIAFFADTETATETGSSEVVKYSIIATTDSNGVGDFKTSAHTYFKNGAPPATYKVTLVKFSEKAPSDTLSKLELEEKSPREIAAYQAKIKAELAAMPGFIPFEWGNIKTTPIKITVPENGGTITIEVTESKTYQQ
ncbi:MAG: DUF4198 domain-containing protein [Planctomycetaceae bacterium]|nr:DUF4198 domain-containing protein [Planctomycetaceae bacterium]